MLTSSRDKPCGYPGKLLAAGQMQEMTFLDHTYSEYDNKRHSPNTTPCTHCVSPSQCSSQKNLPTKTPFDPKPRGLLLGLATAQKEIHTRSRPLLGSCCCCPMMQTTLVASIRSPTSHCQTSLPLQHGTAVNTASFHINHSWELPCASPRFKACALRNA